MIFHCVSSALVDHCKVLACKILHHKCGYLHHLFVKYCHNRNSELFLVGVEACNTDGHEACPTDGLEACTTDEHEACHTDGHEACYTDEHEACYTDEHEACHTDCNVDEKSFKFRNLLRTFSKYLIH